VRTTCVSGVAEGVACPAAARPAASTAGQIVEVVARPVASRQRRGGIEASAGSRRGFTAGRERSHRCWQIGAGHGHGLGWSENDGAGGASSEKGSDGSTIGEDFGISSGVQLGEVPVQARSGHRWRPPGRCSGVRAWVSDGAD